METLRNCSEDCYIMYNNYNMGNHLCLKGTSCDNASGLMMQVVRVNNLRQHNYILSGGGGGTLVA